LKAHADIVSSPRTREELLLSASNYPQFISEVVNQIDLAFESFAGSEKDR